VASPHKEKREEGMTRKMLNRSITYSLSLASKLFVLMVSKENQSASPDARTCPPPTFDLYGSTLNY
jgi:hypothetical protein